MQNEEIVESEVPFLDFSIDLQVVEPIIPVTSVGLCLKIRKLY